jgi:hypothetical protein
MFCTIFFEIVGWYWFLQFTLEGICNVAKSQLNFPQSLLEVLNFLLEVPNFLLQVPNFLFCSARCN